jgi:hypothetical protein
MSHKTKEHSNKQHTEPNKDSGQENERKIRGDIHVHGEVEANLPPDFVKQRKAERNEDAAQASKNYIVQLATLGALIVYAGFTFWQGYLTRESIKNNTREFQIDQRPYVWTSNVDSKTSIKAGERMWANIHMINYGKSPALRTSGTALIFVGSNAKKDAEQWFAANPDQAFTDTEGTQTVVPPGILPPFPDNPEKAMFGGGGYFTAMSQHVLSQTDVDYILQYEESAVIVARLQYFDGFGNHYWSDICLSRFTNGSTPHCTKHNEIH